MIICVTLFRTFKAYKYDCSDALCWGQHVRNQVITRLDSMMFGFLGAYIKYYTPSRWISAKNRTFYIGIIILLIPQLYDYFIGGMVFKNYFLFTFTSMGTLLMLPKLSSVNKGVGIFYVPITIISLISYSMYLLNYTLVKDFIIVQFERFIPYLQYKTIWTSLFEYVIFWIITILLSILVYKYYELPMTAIRDRIKVKK